MTKKNERTTRATSVEMDALHANLAETYTEALKKYREAGETPSPQFLSALQKFLADNGVDVPDRARGVDRLRGQIPDMDELEKSGNVVPLTR